MTAIGTKGNTADFKLFQPFSPPLDSTTLSLAFRDFPVVEGPLPAPPILGVLITPHTKPFSKPPNAQSLGANFCYLLPLKFVRACCLTSPSVDKIM